MDNTPLTHLGYAAFIRAGFEQTEHEGIKKACENSLDARVGDMTNMNARRMVKEANTCVARTAAFYQAIVAG